MVTIAENIFSYNMEMLWRNLKLTWTGMILRQEWLISFQAGTDLIRVADFVFQRSKSRWETRNELFCKNTSFTESGVHSLFFMEFFHGFSCHVSSSNNKKFLFLVFGNQIVFAGGSIFIAKFPNYVAMKVSRPLGCVSWMDWWWFLLYAWHWASS